MLTGAGISAESGLDTFRDAGGLWGGHRVQDVATPQAFARDPQLVWRFYKQRYLQALSVAPNAGHLALKELEDTLGDRFWLITQNVDGLHDAAGNKNLIEMHGSLHRCFCTACGKYHHTGEIDLDSPLPSCSKCQAMLRPDIVWFGEYPYHMNKIDQILDHSDILLIVGTSGNVYPAAGFVISAKHQGITTVAVNLDPPENRSYIDHFYHGKSGEILPRLMEHWISSTRDSG